MPILFVLREVPELTIAQFTPGILKPFSVVLSVHCYCHVTAIKSDQNIECEIPVFPNQGLFRVTMLSANLFTTLGYLKMHVKNLSTFRSSHQRCYMKKGVLEILQNSQYNKNAAGLRPMACNFIKKETLAQVFSCEFCKISKNIFFTEHL